MRLELIEIPKNEFEARFTLGTVKDALFFVDQIVKGVPSGNFSSRALSFSVQLDLFGKCCRALYWQHLDDLLGRNNGGALYRPLAFRVAKQGGTTVGAMLLEINYVNSGAVIVGVANMVVDAAWRGKGVGSRLLGNALAQAPVPSTVICACSPNSERMMHLLNKFGFKLIGKSETTNGIVSPHVYEYRKLRPLQGDV